MKNKARIAGIFYLVTFVAGSLSLMLGAGLRPISSRPSPILA